MDALSNIEDMDIEKLRNILEVNTLSYIRLFQATRLLLNAAADKHGDGGTPKLLAITSNAGTAVDMSPTSRPGWAATASASLRSTTWCAARTLRARGSRRGSCTTASCRPTMVTPWPGFFVCPRRLTSWDGRLRDCLDG